MSGLFKFLLPAAAAVGLFVGLGSKPVKAADAPAGGVITGTVLDKDGKPVADATVHLMKPHEKGAGAPAAGGAKPAPLASATTGADGKFSLSFDSAKVPDGDYNLGAMMKGMGGGRAKVKITAGKADPADVSITLKEGGHHKKDGGDAAKRAGDQPPAK